MKLSWIRTFQWIGIFAVLVFVVALRYEAPSEAKKTVDAPFESRTDQGIVGYWKLDTGSGTSAIDSSGNGNDLSFAGSPSWTTGNIGPYSLDFSGSGQYLSVADPSSGVLDFVDGADFTISGWFNRDTAAADHTIVAKKNDQTTSAGYVVWIDNNGSTDYLSAEISDGTDTYSAIGTTDLSSTGWHHFAVVWNDGTGLYIYLDGKLDGSTTTSTTSINSLANALAFRIGAESDAGVPFDGKIDDVKLYGKALSANDILTLSQTTVPATPASTAGLDSGLVGHWTFDGPDVNWGDTSNEIKDVSGRGNHGDAAGSLATTSVTPGKLGQALIFNGTTNRVTISASSSLGNITQKTISIWIKPTGWGELSYGQPITSNYNSDDKWWISLCDENAGCNNFSGSFIFGQLATGGDGEGMWYAPQNTVILNEWQHIVVEYDCGSGSNDPLFFRNGSSISVSEFYTPGTPTCDDSLADKYIGASYGGANAFAGLIDDVRFYNRLLSAIEVSNLYDQGR